jgi:hypothetical protein
MKDIKSLKPRRKSRFKQGYVDTSTLKKLFESQKSKPVIFRSSYEHKFIWWLERSSSVKRWGSEPICIEYRLPNDEKVHHYWPDYLVEMTDGTVVLVEVKPHNQTVPPDPYLNDRDSLAYRTYVKNYCKWKAANEFCKRNNMQFKILTEKTIERL